jgi:D-beta-D-heptose 7-phosphate kinase/D-beta-D-heptose 1-phosphate adenosyltransferase
MSHDLADYIRAMKGKRVVVLGDPMLDEYHHGHVDRLSPEAPVPIFVQDSVEVRDGGAANVVKNLAGLRCDVVTLFPPAPWTIKHRYLVGAQQLLRIDRDQDHSEQLRDYERAIDWSKTDAVVISDYAKGWCTRSRCQNLITYANSCNVRTIVDPKGEDWTKYAGATLVCPNDKEMVGHYDWPGHLLHKQGAKGMTLIYPDKTQVHFDARAHQVFDVTGAGDTVVAVLAAAIAAGAPLPQAAELANIGAGVVVGRVGTYALTADELLQALQ